MKKNKSAYIWIAVIVVVLAVLFAYPRLTSPNRGLTTKFNQAGIDCLRNHSVASQHIHPHLTIRVDGREEPLPANIGLTGSCMAEIHTHDGSGTIHVESVSAGKTFTLKEIFTVWDKPLERPGYNLTATANGQPVSDPASIVLDDRQQIILEYKKAGN